MKTAEHAPKSVKPLKLSLTNKQQVTLHIEPKTADGRPVVPSQLPVWKPEYGDIVLTPSADGLSCRVNTKSGCDAQVSVTVSGNFEDGEARTVTQRVSFNISDENGDSNSEYPANKELRAQAAKDAAALNLIADKPELQSQQ